MLTHTALCWTLMSSPRVVGQNWGNISPGIGDGKGQSLWVPLRGQGLNGPGRAF